MNHRLFLALLLSLSCLGGPVFAAATPPESAPNLVDKLLAILGNKNLPRIDIPAPAPPATPKAAPPRYDGLEIASNFLPIYALDREMDENPPVLPFYASGPLNQSYHGVTTLLIMVPDKDREAAKAFAYARAAQDEASARHPEWDAADSFIFAPQFLESDDIEAHASSWPDGGAALLRWPLQGWIIGGDSVGDLNNQPQGVNNWMQKRGLSSFAVMDFLLLTLARPKLFPDLKRVVIAGSGMGGDFVQRYAALGVSPDILNDEGIEVRFVPALTHSFFYLDANRAGKSVAGEYKSADDVPQFSEFKKDDCPRANSYPYGLESLPAYARRQGENGIRLRYPTRTVFYLTSEGATLPLTDTTPDSCALTLQGSTLRERSSIYYAGMIRLYGSDAERTQRLLVAPKINEDALALWRSACGTAALFGDGLCDK